MPEAGSEAADLLVPSDSRAPVPLVQRLEELADSSDVLLEDRAFDPDPEVRAIAVVLLTERGRPAAAEILASALEDPSPDVVLLAAEGLARLRPERAADRLAECLAVRPELLGPLALAMERLGDPGLEDLLWQWTDEAAPAARIALLRAVGACGGPRSIPRLLRLVESEGARLPALHALARIRERHPESVGRGSVPEAAVPRILELARSPERSLALTGITLALWLRPRGTLEIIVDRMGSEDPRVRDAALEAFGRISADAEGLALEALALGSPEAIGFGLDRLATARDPAARRALMRLLEHAEGEVRERAASLAGRSGHPDSVPALTRLLADPVGHVRARAAEALGRLRAEPVGPALTALLHDPYPDVREAAVGALAHLRGLELDVEAALAATTTVGGRAAILRAADLARAPRALEAAVGAPEAEIRIAVAASLARRGVWETAATPLLLDEDARVRAHAVDARLRKRPPTDPESLRPILHDPDAGVRQVLALGLAGAPGRRALDWLRELTRDACPGVARAAARGLGGRTEPEALLALLDASSGGSVPLAAAAIEALAERGDPEALPRLRAIARGGPEPLQALAERAVQSLSERKR